MVYDWVNPIGGRSHGSSRDNYQIITGKRERERGIFPPHFLKITDVGKEEHVGYMSSNDSQMTSLWFNLIRICIVYFPDSSSNRPCWICRGLEDWELAVFRLCYGLFVGGVVNCNCYLWQFSMACKITFFHRKITYKWARIAILHCW